MTLRWFHMVFLLLAIMGADLFGGWAIRASSDGDRSLLIMGVVSMVGGLGLCGYVLWLVRKLDQAHIS